MSGSASWTCLLGKHCWHPEDDGKVCCNCGKSTGKSHGLFRPFGDRKMGES